MTATRCAACVALCGLLNACGIDLDLGGHVVPSDAPVGSARGPCTPEVTIQSLAFYGTGTPGVSVCGGVAPPVATIMNSPYSVAPTTGNVTYGLDSYSWATYTNESPGQVTPTVTLDPNTGALTIAGQVSNPDGTPGHFILAGFGFKSTSCLDASNFAGIRFDVTGDFSGCKVLFEADTSEDSSSVFASVGQCDASQCVSPSYALTQTGTVQVPFTAFGNGDPQATADSASIQSMQWVFIAP